MFAFGLAYRLMGGAYGLGLAARPIGWPSRTWPGG